MRACLITVVVLGSWAGNFFCAARGGDVEYIRDIQPLLAVKCGACHGAIKQEAGLRLDAGKLILRGSDDGEIVNLAAPVKSRLLQRVTADDPAERMPPEGDGEKLTTQQVGLLRDWITAGGKYPSDEIIPPSPSEHWAYVRPAKSDLPRVKDAAWQANPIDAFLAKQHEEQGLSPQPTADKGTLLRRVYLDLIGLPPSREQLLAFIADQSPQAYEHVVDDLLASPRYGERWGRHWMDVWRYSDWSGYKEEIRTSQRHIWHWRDWIVESLNNEKPYDRMVSEMLAADELAPADPQTLRATGFLVRNWFKANRDKWLDETVEHTAKAFLGMTLNCAKCHDHKYDPLSQESYYAFRALFEPHQVRTDPIEGEVDLTKNGLPRVYDKDLETLTYLYERGNEKHPRKEHPITPSVPEILKVSLRIDPVQLPVAAYYPAIEDKQLSTLLKSARDELQQAQQELELKQAADDAEETLVYESLLRFEIATVGSLALEARIVAERAKYLENAGEGRLKELSQAATLAETQLAQKRAKLEFFQAERALISAMQQQASTPDEKKAKDAVVAAQKKQVESKQKLQNVTAKLAQPGERYTPLGTEHPRTSSGRRLALARWMIDRRNPLTSRVCVNHIWQRHFATPLVETSFDFGLRSPLPLHAELLDWLSVELMDNDWHMKPLHRLIVTSRTYRSTSSIKDAAPANLQLDPDNHYLWRMNSHRLEAEAVRDSILAASDSLNLTMGGPDISEDDGQVSRRRSLYFRHAYEKKVLFLELFDAANETDCYRRSESIMPQQALALANSQLAIEQSRLLAGKLFTQANAEAEGTPGKAVEAVFIQLAFETLFSRLPRIEESEACGSFLQKQSQLLNHPEQLSETTGSAKVSVPPSKDPQQRARESLIHVLLNHHDFVTIH